MNHGKILKISDSVSFLESLSPYLKPYAEFKRNAIYMQQMHTMNDQVNYSLS